MYTVIPSASFLLTCVAPFAALAAIILAEKVELADASPSTVSILFKAVFAALVCAAVSNAANEMDAALLLLALSALTFFAAFDVRYFAVPVLPLIALIGLGLGLTALSYPQATLEHFSAAVLGWLVFAVLAASYRKLRGEEGLGAGDGLLAAAIGAWFGVDGLAWSVAIGCAATVVWAMTWARTGLALPLAPGLTAGAAIVSVLAPSIVGSGP